MRQVVLGLGMSLDGYIARCDGAVDFLMMEPDYNWSAFFKTVDTWLLGRKTMDVAKRMSPGGKFDSSGLKTFVFSRTLPPGPADGVEYTSCAPADLVSELRSKPGKDIWLGGGGELVRDFLKADLVDQIQLGIVPVLLGDGIPLFSAGFPESKWRLLESRAYPKKGMLTVSYERLR